MDINCPHCKIDFNSEDISHTLKNGNFKCPVCDKKIPSLLAEDQKSNSPSPFVKYLVPAFIVAGIAVASIVIHFLTSAEKTASKLDSVTPAITKPSTNPSPAPVSAPPIAPVVQVAMPAQQAQQPPDKMKVVERIAAMYHATHSYTMDGGFVCLDMAIDVWNQLKTYGIEAKIMGGTIKQNITAWNFRQLAMESDHAWVVAEVSPMEKVAIETTTGAVIKSGMTGYPAYFKGIEFDSPAQIKRFEVLRKKAHEVCREANQLIKDWNDNVAGKQHKTEETIANQSRIEQRKLDCENTFKEMKEFESRAIFY